MSEREAHSWRSIQVLNGQDPSLSPSPPAAAAAPRSPWRQPSPALASAGQPCSPRGSRPGLHTIPRLFPPGNCPPAPTARRPGPSGGSCSGPRLPSRCASRLRLFRSRCSLPGPSLSRCACPVERTTLPPPNPPPQPPPGLGSRGCSGPEMPPQPPLSLNSASVQAPLLPHPCRPPIPRLFPSVALPPRWLFRPGALRPAGATRPGPRAASSRREEAQGGTAASPVPAAAHPPGPRRSSAPFWSRRRWSPKPGCASIVGAVVAAASGPPGGALLPPRSSSTIAENQEWLAGPPASRGSPSPTWITQLLDTWTPISAAF